MIIVDKKPEIFNETKTKKTEPKSDKKSQSSDSESSSLPSKKDSGIRLSAIELKLNFLTNKLLEKLKSGLSKGQTTELLTKAKNAKIAPNLANDLKLLLEDVKKSPELVKFSEPLKEFNKSISKLNHANLKSQIQNSGIMLEAKIAQSLEKNILPPKIKNLLSLMKSSDSKALQEAFLTLPNDDNVDKNFKDLKEVLNKVLKDNTQALKGSVAKNIFSILDNFQNTIKFLDKISSSFELGKFPKNEEQFLDNKIKILENTSKNLEILSKEIKNLSIPKNGQNIANLKESLSSDISKLNNQLKELISDFKNPVQATSENKNIQNKLSLENLLSLDDTSSNQKGLKNQALIKFGEIINNKDNNPSLQNKLNFIQNKVSNLTASLFPKSLENKNTILETKALLKASEQASNEISKILPQNDEKSAASIKSDLKSMLLEIKTSSDPSSSAHQNASRMISQIEVNQLLSFTNGTFETNLPYLWEELESSSMSLKRGKKNKYYAKIDLTFKKYGQISIVLALFDSKFLDVSILTKQEEFKDKILANSHNLKKSLIKKGLIINSFYLAQENSNSPYQNLDESLDMGFDIKA